MPRPHPGREQRFAIGPGDWTALPFGMWALIVLTRRDVRAAFADPNETRARTIPTSRATGRRRVILGITLTCLLLLTAVWLGAPFVRYVRNRAVLEFVPQPGLTQVIVKQNDVTVVDLGMQTSNTASLSPGNYKLGVYLEPGYQWEGTVWELTSVGIFGDHTVHQIGGNYEVEVHRGERVIVRAIPRPAPPVPPVVWGRVTQRGQSIQDGVVTLHFADKGPFSGKIWNGFYRIDLSPDASGPARVTVADVPPPPVGGSLRKKVSSRYSDPEKSGLRITVVGKTQTFDIELNDVE